MTTARLQSRPIDRLAGSFALPAGITWNAVGFSLRTTVASLCALYIAFLADLDTPKWAAMTVWIVAQSSRGMSISKGVYRLGGTIAGCVTAIILLPLLDDAPELLFLFLGAWVATCAGASAILRNFRSYGAVLAGYTAVIIVMDAASSPGDVFDIAMARTLDIVIGILVEGIFSAVFAPGDAISPLRNQLAAYAGEVKVTLRNALDGAANPRLFEKLLVRAVSLQTSAEYARAAHGHAARSFRHFDAAIAALLRQIYLTYSLSLRSSRLRAASDAHPPSLIAMVDKLAAGETLTPSIRRRLFDDANAKCLHMLPYTASDDRERGLLLDSLVSALQAHQDAERHIDLFDRPQQRMAKTKFSFHRDYVLAVHTSLRAVFAFALPALFWIMTAWPNGPSTVVLSSVITTLFATRPNPIAGGIGFLKGGLLAILATAVCDFAILPAFSDFTPLAILLGSILFVAGLVVRTPKYAATATCFAFLFIDLVGPSNTARADATAFFNGAIALTLGVAIGTLAFHLWPNRERNAVRAHIQGKIVGLLPRLGANAQRWTQSRFAFGVADRLAKRSGLGAGSGSHEAEADLRDALQVLTIGMAMIELRQMSPMLSGLGQPLNEIGQALKRGDLAMAAEAARLAADRMSSGIGAAEMAEGSSRIHAVTLLADIELAYMSRNAKATLGP